MTLIALLIPILIYADGWTASNPSHSTLYADTITSKTDASSVNIADSQGLFVTGDITTLGRVGIGTTSPGTRLQVNGDIVLADSDVNYAAGQLTRLSGHPGWYALRTRYVASDSNHVPGFIVGGAASQSIALTTNSYYRYGDGVWAAPESTTAPVWWAGIDGCGPACAADKFYIMRGPPSVSAPTWATMVNLFTILSNGNVGIGTTSPTAKLEVGTNVELSVPRITALGYSATVPLVHLGDSADYGTSVFFDIQRTNLNKWEIDMSNDLGISGGKVGIGTTSPQAKLTVSEGNVRSDCATATCGFEMTSNNVIKWRMLNRADVSNRFELRDTAENPIFVVEQGAPANQLIVKSSGNVGIGTTSPGARLHVSAAGAPMAIIDGAGSGDAQLTLRRGAGGDTQWHLVGRGGATGKFDIRNEANANPNFALYQSGGMSVGTTFAVTEAPANGAIIQGNVGIGTTNPGAKQTILGGDVYIATIGNGIILKDVDGTCRRVILSGGSLSVSGVIACPAS